MIDERFRIELFRLLLQVTWADDAVDASEVEALLGRARAWGVPPSELSVLEERIRAHEPLPAPNLGLLRPRKEEVLAELRALAGADGTLASDESELIAEIEALLG